MAGMTHVSGSGPAGVFPPPLRGRQEHPDVCDAIREFMRRGEVIRTVINNFTFDGSTKDPMQQAVRDALIAFMAATTTELHWQERNEGGNKGGSAGRNRTCAGKGRWCVSWPLTRQQFVMVGHMLGHDAVGIARIAKETGLSRQMVYRIKGDPSAAEAALETWGLLGRGPVHLSKFPWVHQWMDN
jgi:putative DNA-invertase from lambdoid prophage Rac